MFWRFGGYANISTIDSILEKNDFSLEELLDEADLIQELKQHNAKLVEYVREQKVLEKLLEYVVAPKLEPVATPDDDEEVEGKGVVLPFSRPRASSRATDSSRIGEEEAEKKRNRYAFVAAEILSCDSWSIIEALMESKHLLRNFWQFLKRPTPLDPLQASYFTKVNEWLFDKKTEEMIELLKSLDDAVPDMIRHVDSPMIMDLLLRIISLERTPNGHGIVEWLYTQNVMPTLLSFLGPEHSWATQTSAGDFMKAIITVSANASQNEQTCIGPNELTRQLVSRPCVEQLIKYMLGGGNPLTVGVGIVIEVIRKNNSDYDPDVGAEPNSIPSSRDPIYLGTLLRLFAEHVPNFMNLIMNAPAQKERLTSTFGDKIEPLGFDRFKTCELMAELLHCSNMGLLNVLGSEELISARDAERQRLRSEGKLTPFRGEEAPSSAEDLTIRIAHSNPVDEIRRLEVTNISADDDGFEEVTHGGDEEFVRAEEDIPDLPEVSSHSRTSSFLDKDEDDFVDEPLSSPRLNVRDMDEKKDEDNSFEDPDLVVPPLSPTKVKAAQQGDPTPVVGEGKVEQSPDATKKLMTESTPDDSQPAESETENQQGVSKGEQAKTPIVLAETSPKSHHPGYEGSKEPHKEVITPQVGLSPRPEDTPAPLFSRPSGSKDSGSSDERSPTQSDSQAGGKEVSESVEAEVHDVEQGEEASIIVGHATEHQAPSEERHEIAPVVGDYLKMQFVEYRVVPTILSFFFKYPWNNFLHNVVYDIVQQVFNGPMDRGYNPTLAISLFEAADITTLIINGQLASEQSQARTMTRMGYMGHLTLIAEEVVKFTERHPPELLSETILDRVMAQEWINYVEGPLAETRERDNAILGGVRPEVAMSNRAGGASGLSAVGLSSLGLSGLGGGGTSQSASNALAEAGLNGGLDAHESGGNGIGPFAISAGTLMSGFGSSSDEDDDEEQESEEDVNNEFRAYTDPLNAANQSSLTPPSIPPPPPPPPPLNTPPSRARLQLAARLAMNKRNAAAAAAAAATGAAENSTETNTGDGNSVNPPGVGSSSVDQFDLLKSLHTTGGGGPPPELAAAAERLRERDRELLRNMRDPFADEEEDGDEDDDADADVSGSGSASDDGEGDAGVGGTGSGWHRGSWWRGVVRSARRSARKDRAAASTGASSSSSGGGGGGGGRESRGVKERFGDGRDDDSDDSEGDAGIGDEEDDVDEEMDDEEFGDFAMPEVAHAPVRQAGGGVLSSGDAGSGRGADDDSKTPDSTGAVMGIDPAREKILLKPLPVHPTVGKTSVSPFGSLWPFSTQSFGISGGKEKEKDEGRTYERLHYKPVEKKDAETAARKEAEISEEPFELEVGEGEGVIGEDGKKIDRAVEAQRRTSIEDPDDDDDDDDIEVGEEIIVGRGGLS